MSHGGSPSAPTPLPSPRVIPACAGNACCTGIPRTWTTVHPRMRGEREYLVHGSDPHHGSSPHARGTPPGRHTAAELPRFIPACAGNACSGRFPRFPPAVHPRMRGERRTGVELPPSMDGSSPHARGTPKNKPAQRRSRRFIPACAGNARRVSAAFRPTSVHPRMRGERNPKDIGVMLQDGSSPHARGTQSGAADPEKPWRFIPACAGNAKH